MARPLSGFGNDHGVDYGDFTGRLATGNAPKRDEPEPAKKVNTIASLWSRKRDDIQNSLRWLFWWLPRSIHTEDSGTASNYFRAGGGQEAGV